MHSDLRARDSLACDLMEAIRPQADEYVLELIKNREFVKSNFFETREGICRILAPLCREIAQTACEWRELIAPIAEGVAQRLFKNYQAIRATNSTPAISGHGFPTPLTGMNRSAGISIQPSNADDQRVRVRKLYRKRNSSKLDCIKCSKQIDGKHRMYCEACRL